MLKRNIISLILVLTIVSSIFPIMDVSSRNAVYDREFNINGRSVVINSNGTYRIYGSGETSNNIIVPAGLDNVTLILDNIHIDLTGQSELCPLEVQGNSKVTIELVGDNILKSYYYKAAIQVNRYDAFMIGSVKITGNGTLTAIGGKYAAAIGSGYRYSAGNIEIENGTIYAVGGEKGSGIGGSYNEDAEKINISGGTIHAEGTDGGAGIGGGYGGSSKLINITGGTITATGSGGGSGIGGGYRGIGGEINISGGRITAYGAEHASGIGSGQHAKGSSIRITQGSDILAFSSGTTTALEDGSLDVDSSLVLFSGMFEYDYFQEDEEIKFESGYYEKDLILPYGYRNFVITLDEVGDYSIRSSTSTILYRDDEIEKLFNIENGYNSFVIQPEETCILTEPIFKIEDVFLKPNETTTTIPLEASGSSFNRGRNCINHNRSYAVSYEYIIKEDVAGIAEIKNNNLILDVPIDGEYRIIVTVKAKAGGLEVAKDTQFMVIKHSDALEMESDMIIDQNGVYTIREYTRQHSIIVEADLDDVTLVLDNVTMDLSENPNSKGIPISIGSRSKVNIVLKGSNTLISNKKGNPIHLESSSDGNKTQVKIRGDGILKIRNPAKGPAIGTSDEGKNTEIFLLEGDIRAEAVDGPVIGSYTSAEYCNLFISDQVKLSAVNASTKYTPIQAVIKSGEYEGFTSAIIVQGKVSGRLPVDSTIINVGNSSKVYNFERRSAWFATSVKEYGQCTISFRDEKGYNKYFLRESKGVASKKYFELIDPVNYFELSYKKCGCRITSPSFKVANLVLPYDVTSETIELEAKGARFILDNKCVIHTNTDLDYRYVLVEDESGRADVRGYNLYLSNLKPGRYRIRVGVIVSAADMDTRRETSFTVTKLTDEETMKQAHRLFGDEHQAYINGYNDNTFRPNNLITRAEVAALISRISPKYNTYRYYSSNFNDVHRGQWYYDSVAFMEYEQYISGYEDNSFRPNNPITRAEFSVIVCKANNIKATSARNNFEDVKGHWAEGYITALNRRKYINGYPNGEFQPDSPITRAEVVTVLNKVLNREPNKDRMDEEVIINPFKDLPRHHWAYYDILEASETHYEKEWH